MANKQTELNWTELKNIRKCLYLQIKYWTVTIQMKAMKTHFHVLVFEF